MYTLTLVLHATTCIVYHEYGKNTWIDNLKIASFIETCHTLIVTSLLVLK